LIGVISIIHTCMRPTFNDATRTRSRLTAASESMPEMFRTRQNRMGKDANASTNWLGHFAKVCTRTGSSLFDSTMSSNVLSTVYPDQALATTADVLSSSPFVCQPRWWIVRPSLHPQESVYFFPSDADFAATVASNAFRRSVFFFLSAKNSPSVSAP
jgi:hypothetical protein